MSPRPLPQVPTALPARECCAPLGRGPLGADEASRLASRLKALADGPRLRMLSLMLASEGDELRTRDLVEPLALSQPTVSHHLRQLADAGLVAAERRGGETWYAVDRGNLVDLGGLLQPPC